MPRPGTTVVVSEALPPAAAPTATDTGFFVGEAQRGPVDVPALIRSSQNFADRFGEIIPQSPLAGAIDAFFGEGGARAYVLRLADDTAARATATQGGLTVEAVDPGAWGDQVHVEVTVGTTAVAAALAAAEPRLELAENNQPGRRRRRPPPIAGAQDNGNGNGGAGPGEPLTVEVRYRGELVERGQGLLAAQDLVGWAANSNYIRVRANDETAPLAAGSFDLSGGTDGTLPVTDPYALLAALQRLDVALGPGQLAAPGKTSAGHHEAILRGAELGNRVAYLDGDPQASVSALIAHAAQLRGLGQARFGGLWAQRAAIPGRALGTQRLVPWSTVQAALQARNDAAGGNPNQAAAGAFGTCRYVTGLEREFTDPEREVLMYAGVNTVKIIYSRPRSYGVRTLVDERGTDRAWLWLPNVRLAMAIKARAEAIAERYLFQPIDGAGLLFAALANELAGMLGAYWPGGLYGETEADAFRIEVGETVNTPETIAAGEVRAMIGLHMAPPAEWVFIQVIKVPITEPL